MLIDGAIKFATMGREGLAAGDHEKSYEGFSQARAIVTELMTSVRQDVAPELCERMRSLYTFMYTELVSASLEKDIGKADRVIELLGFERETWVMLMEQLKAERAAGAFIRALRAGVGRRVFHRVAAFDHDAHVSAPGCGEVSYRVKK